MAKLQIKYRTEGKALPPRPIKVAVPGWAGSAAFKKENGSEPQPWHCPLFMEACTYGVELVYQYETECHIANNHGKVEILWDRHKAPGELGGLGDFSLSLPSPPQNFLFATSIDIQPPPGYILRIETHPRFFGDTTGSVPVALSGHVPGEWWPKKLFVVFKVPEPGQRIIFRKGEPYVQILFIPRDEIELHAMTPEEAASRRRLEEDISRVKSLVAKNVWNSGSGVEFNDHFKVFSRAFERDGMDGIFSLVLEGLARLDSAVPPGKTIAEYLELAKEHHKNKRYVETKETLHHVLLMDRNNADAYNHIASLEWELGLKEASVRSLRRAASLQPNNPQYLRNLGELHRRMGQNHEAEQAYAAALAVYPDDPEALVAHAFFLGRRGQVDEALNECRKAMELSPAAPGPHFVNGLILSWSGRREESLASLEKALSIDPGFAPAKKALEELRSADGAAPPNR